MAKHPLTSPRLLVPSQCPEAGFRSTLQRPRKPVTQNVFRLKPTLYHCILSNSCKDLTATRLHRSSIEPGFLVPVRAFFVGRGEKPGSLADGTQSSNGCSFDYDYYYSSDDGPFSSGASTPKNSQRCSTQRGRIRGKVKMSLRNLKLGCPTVVPVHPPIMSYGFSEFNLLLYNEDTSTWIQVDRKKYGLEDAGTDKTAGFCCQ